MRLGGIALIATVSTVSLLKHDGCRPSFSSSDGSDNHIVQQLLCDSCFMCSIAIEQVCAASAAVEVVLVPWI